MKDLHEASKGSLLAKLDLKDAYQHIPIRSTNWHLLGFHWQGNFYYPILLMFGSKSAPYIFNLFAEGLHWIIQHHIPASLHHYLDDFLPIFLPSTPKAMANAATDWIEHLGNELGLSFQLKKTVQPSMNIEFLGLELDSMAMEAHFLDEKLIYLRRLLDSWLQQSKCSLWDIQELTNC